MYAPGLMSNLTWGQVAGMAPQAVLDRMQSMAPMRPTETMAQQALGGQQGGTYLAPALYRPVVQVSPRFFAFQRSHSLWNSLATMISTIAVGLRKLCHRKIGVYEAYASRCRYIQQ